MKPHEALAPAPRLPLKATLEAVTFVVPETPAFQELAIAVPEGKLQLTVHFEMDDEPAVTVTSPCQPPDHVPTTLIEAEHAPVPPPPLLLVVVVVGSPPPPLLLVVVVVVVVTTGRVVVVVVVVGVVPVGATARPVEGEIMPGQRPRDFRPATICGIAAVVVFGYGSCMRIT